MSNESNHSEQDPLVSGIYKELAGERAPDHLDKQVLRMAAREGRTRYSLARAWTRPVAWAAMIGLSLAVVLELSRLPQIEVEAPAPAARTDVPASIPPADRAIEAKVKDDRPAAKRSDALSMDALAPQGTAVLREAESRARAQEGPTIQVPVAAPAELVRKAGPAEELVAPAEERESAEELAPVEEVLGDDVSAGASFAVVGRKKELETDLACPTLVRESAETWFECIKNLRETGPVELAEREFEEFQRIFPDFIGAEVDR